jgi:putative IMPACT (imprinted ancient) family translation regulator
VIQQDYNENVLLTLALPEEKLKDFQQHLQTLSSGQLQLQAITANPLTN